MLSEYEELRILQTKAEMMKRGLTPWRAASIEEEYDALRERLTYFEDLQKDIVDLSSDKIAASLLWAEVSRQDNDVMQRCSRFASMLYAKDLINHDQFTTIIKKCRFIPNVTRKARQAEEEEDKALNDAIDQVLNAVDKVNRIDALQQYNVLEGFRTWEKLNTWATKLVELGYLPKTYLAGVRGGVNLEKMLHPFANKELRAKENK